ncbi:MAG: PIN domain-containing protein [Propionibacteriaceae bacterium]|jgi:hypothetical protein|nr:PIN domain-containing protein [Propionibacteriaceae bacterium]
MTQRVLLDACVLLPISLCDVLLDLADAALFDPAWSDIVLAETRRTLVDKRGLAPGRADARIGQMRSAYPNSTVTGFDHLIPMLRNHPKDRHVLAAVAGGCPVIVTVNLTDFPAAALGEHGVTAVHPDDFLVGLWRSHRDSVVAALRRKVSSYRNPPMTLAEFADILSPLVPAFAALVAAEPDIRQ